MILVKLASKVLLGIVQKFVFGNGSSFYHHRLGKQFFLEPI
ncbi:hypothetical protein LEP1GSC059_3105 [Leptospira noguchii serovar Panama str. CZ214]|uniref:Uncharacterized protein n=1 Tax=Leptospira noguchii serovar Panama str. CZ214 TaxID=1001595 RepID=T0FCV6_9LEPT|nr:hypothetical protein LEP1GSC059_3105 [Leptospira noguchii serovar Panama str. CZ214]